MSSASSEPKLSKCCPVSGKCTDQKCDLVDAACSSKSKCCPVSGATSSENKCGGENCRKYGSVCIDWTPFVESKVPVGRPGGKRNIVGRVKGNASRFSQIPDGVHVFYRLETNKLTKRQRHIVIAYVYDRVTGTAYFRACFHNEDGNPKSIGWSREVHRYTALKRLMDDPWTATLPLVVLPPGDYVVVDSNKDGVQVRKTITRKKECPDWRGLEDAIRHQLYLHKSQTQAPTTTKVEADCCGFSG